MCWWSWPLCSCCCVSNRYVVQWTISEAVCAWLHLKLQSMMATTQWTHDWASPRSASMFPHCYFWVCPGLGLQPACSWQCIFPPLHIFHPRSPEQHANHLEPTLSLIVMPPWNRGPQSPPTQHNMPNIVFTVSWVHMTIINLPQHPCFKGSS